MKKAALLSILILSSTSFAQAGTLCFDATAKASKSAVLKALGMKAAITEVSVFQVSDSDNYSDGTYKNYKGPNKGFKFNTREASGSAYVGGDRQGATQMDFVVTVDTKAGTCDVINTEVKFVGGGTLE
jgi:hypothetical protein